ncbi:MAG: hypothetical protein GXP35_13410 [Actinobacteria bacterium]|nr:hypothetical protein [Actinomycetota bacterium]
MRLAAIVAVLALTAAACNNSDGAQRAVVADPDAVNSTTTQAASAVETSVPAAQAALIDISDGIQDETRPDVVWYTATIDGIEVEYAVGQQADIAASDEERPVLLAFPAGPQTRAIAESLLDNYWIPAAVDKGWTVITPVAPGGRLFFQGSEELIPPLLDAVLADAPPEGGRVHVAGVSNGGISSFRALALYPERIASVLVLPGFARSEFDLLALDTVGADDFGVPVTLWVGANDGQGWIDGANSTADRLAASGAIVSVNVVPDEGHIIAGLTGGVEISEVLEAARQTS